MSSDVCMLKKAAGSGSSSLTRWFYNIRQCKCFEFTYKGLGGNGNNFSSKYECEVQCPVTEIPGEATHVMASLFGGDAGASLWFIADECQLPVDPGSCRVFQTNYYYNVETNTCKKFKYGGCGGNGNRFKTKLDCRMTCKVSLKVTVLLVADFKCSMREANINLNKHYGSTSRVVLINFSFFHCSCVQ